jgi:two-component system cell cycle response regulator
MQRSIRANSDWISRYGGEEFLIVLPETGIKAALFVAEKMCAILSDVPFVTRAGDVSVTASFGVGATGPTGPDIALKVEGLIKAADQSLYRAKQEGRNRYFGIEVSSALALSAIA